MADDHQLIRRVIDGQIDCFRDLVKRHERALFCLIQNMIDDSHEREDLAQETFLAAYRNLNRYDRHRASFATWLLTIGRNKCVNHLKKRRPLVVESLPEESLAREPPSSPEETVQRLSAALSRLPIEQRSVFVLAEIQGLTYAEISKIERVKVGTVKSRMSRAKEKLRCLMSPQSEHV